MTEATDNSSPTLGVSAAPAVSPAPAAGSQKPYTAVVYVHGMGEQRRFEELSRLIDSLDSHAFLLTQEDPLPNRKGRDSRWLVDIKALLEPCRVGGKDDIGFVRMDCEPTDTVHGVGSLYRFYEVYWAPLVAGGSPLTSVIPWLVRQVMTPLRIVGSPWRERQRLRRAALHGLWRRRWLHAISRPNDGDLTKLIDAYDEFEGPVARRDHAKGTFRQFRRFVGKQFEHRPDTSVRVDRIAQLWRLYTVARSSRTSSCWSR